VTVTAGNGSERAEWRRLVQPGGFYVVDRGYVDYIRRYLRNPRGVSIS
jgi:hypothetical protein